MADKTVFKVAAVQMSSVQNDTEATIDKVIQYIEEAGAAGAKVIACPEAIIPGYPWWIWMDGPIQGMDLFCELYNQAIEIPSPQVRRLSSAAREAQAYVCFGNRKRRWQSLSHATMILA